MHKQRVSLSDDERKMQILLINHQCILERIVRRNDVCGGREQIDAWAVFELVRRWHDRSVCVTNNRMGKRNKRKAGAVAGESGGGISFSSDKSLDAKVKSDAEAKAAAAKAAAEAKAAGAAGTTTTATAATATSGNGSGSASGSGSGGAAASSGGEPAVKRVKTDPVPKPSGRITFTGSANKSSAPAPAATTATAAAGTGSGGGAAGGDGDTAMQTDAAEAGGAGGKGRPGARARAKKKEKQQRVKGRDYSELNDEEKNTTWLRHRKADDPISSKFVEYYKGQALLPNEEEWKKFIAALLEPLPITFRLSAITMKRQPLIDRLK